MGLKHEREGCVSSFPTPFLTEIEETAEGA